MNYLNNIKTFTKTIMFGALLTSFAHAEQKVLQHASFLPATTKTNSVMIPKLKAKLEELSDGELTLVSHAGGTLGAGPKTQMRLVKSGGADFAEIPVAYTTGRIKGIDVFELPFLASDNVDGSLKSLELINSGDIKGIDKFIVLGVVQAGPYLIHSKEKISTLADLKGKRIRVSGAVQSQEIAALGAIPVSNIPAPQIAENLNRNLLDGAMVDMGNVYNFRANEDAKYHITNLKLGSFPILFLFNKETYNSLNPKQKKALDAVKGKWFSTELGTIMNEQAIEVQKKLKEDPNHHLVELSDSDIKAAEEKLAPVTEKWRKKSSLNDKIYKKVTN